MTHEPTKDARIGRLKLVLGAVIVTAAAVALTRSEDHPDQAMMPTTAAPRSIGWPMPMPMPDAPAVAPQSATAGPDTDAILKALHLDADTRLDEAVVVDPGQRIVCGRAAFTPAGAPQRWVYAGVAGLAARDDGGPDFAALHQRLCARTPN